MPQPPTTRASEPPDALVHLLQELVAAPLLAAPDLAMLGADKGAYLLLIELTAPLELAIDRLPTASLDPAAYVYCGSARGPGGIRARLRRHFRQQKRSHWHIDRLTLARTPVGAFAVVDGNECELAARLLASGRFDMPVKGFGASDCRRCDSHLLRWRG